MKIFVDAINKEVEVDGDLWTICCDTICHGYSPEITEDEDGNVTVSTYATEEEAQRELDEDIESFGEDTMSDYFVCQVKDIGHRTIFTGSAHGH